VVIIRNSIVLKFSSDIYFNNNNNNNNKKHLISLREMGYKKTSEVDVIRYTILIVVKVI
jgi:hypothetical protein